VARRLPEQRFAVFAVNYSKLSAVINILLTEILELPPCGTGNNSALQAARPSLINQDKSSSHAGERHV
jgi:hypothetical protein